MMGKKGDVTMSLTVSILAFDPGTADTGWALLNGELDDAIALTTHFGVLKTTQQDGDVRSRIDRIGEQMRSLIRVHSPTHIVIEDFTEQGKRVGKTYKEMSWLIEHMRLIGREEGFEVTIYENAQWKKLAVGASRLSKDQVKHFVGHLVQNTKVLQGKPTHVWDSVGIGYAKYIDLQGEN